MGSMRALIRGNRIVGCSVFLIEILRVVLKYSATSKWPFIRERMYGFASRDRSSWPL